MQTTNEQNWHHLSPEETTWLLKSDSRTGLDEDEANRRLEEYGLNRISAKKSQNPLFRFALQFHQPLIYILIASGIITSVLGEWIDSTVIFAVVLANALVGYIQESKAVNALAALAKTMTSVATVLRNGSQKTIPSTDIVPGDIILLQAGGKVPADLRILDSNNLKIDESALTGESFPVDKSPAGIDKQSDLPDRSSMAYASTLVSYGQGRGIVVATGKSTEIGRISHLISTADELATPLTSKIDKFSRILLYVILSFAVVTVIVGLLRGMSLFDMFMAAVALAVGAIPEGLPAAVTITLAIGVSRMARRKAIIRKLPAVETLGSTTIICTDKTGTLTENKMTVQAIIAGDNHYTVTGTGYNPANGTLLHNKNPVDITDQVALKQCLLAGLLCNDSVLRKNEGLWGIEGDPTEGALLVSGAKAGLDVEKIYREYRRIDSMPFDSINQFMASLVSAAGTDQRIYVKGSLEVILSACTTRMSNSGESIPIEKDQIIQQADDLARMGQRVLAFAGKIQNDSSQSLSGDDILSSLTFFGLQGMIDPPRDEAVQAVRICRKAGIAVKMITGDHALTARAIADRIGIGPGNRDEQDITVMTGRELAEYPDAELSGIALRTDVFARTTPEQKLKLVRALQSRQQVVAMTGDGVNDAPALQQADIGVSMGLSGTEVAKDASDMVLTDDNFSSIEAAVEEGRGVFDNLTKFIVWTLPTNLGEGLVITVAIFFGFTLPILPVQILWINMTTAGFLGLMLAFEPKDKGIMLRPPRDPQQPLLSGKLIVRILLVGLLLLVFTFILFEMELNSGMRIEEARTVAVNTFIVIELCYLFNCRSLTRSPFSIGFFSNPWVLVGVIVMLLIQILYTYLPFMNYLFASAPLPLQSWIYILGAGLASALVVEGEKRLRKGKKQQPGNTG